MKMLFGKIYRFLFWSKQKSQAYDALQKGLTQLLAGKKFNDETIAEVKGYVFVEVQKWFDEGMPKYDDQIDALQWPIWKKIPLHRKIFNWLNGMHLNFICWWHGIGRREAASRKVKWL